MTTAPSPTTASLLLAGIGRALEVVEAQIAQQQHQEDLVTAGSIRGDASNDASRLDDLELFAQRLRQITCWLEQDKNLLTVVDDHISQQARKVERRLARQNTRLALTTTLVGALLGWLISSVATPLQLLHTFVH